MDRWAYCRNTFAIFLIELVFSTILLNFGVYFVKHVVNGIYSFERGIWIPIVAVSFYNIARPWSQMYCYILDTFNNQRHRYVISICFLAVVILLDLFLINAIFLRITVYAFIGALYSFISAYTKDYVSKIPTFSPFCNYRLISQFSKAISLLIIPHAITNFYMLDFDEFGILLGHVYTSATICLIAGIALLILSKNHKKKKTYQGGRRNAMVPGEFPKDDEKLVPVEDRYSPSVKENIPLNVLPSERTEVIKRPVNIPLKSIDRVSPQRREGKDPDKITPNKVTEISKKLEYLSESSQSSKGSKDKTPTKHEVSLATPEASTVSNEDDQSGAGEMPIYSPEPDFQPDSSQMMLISPFTPERPCFDNIASRSRQVSDTPSTASEAYPPPNSLEEAVPPPLEAEPQPGPSSLTTQSNGYYTSPTESSSQSNLVNLDAVVKQDIEPQPGPSSRPDEIIVEVIQHQPGPSSRTDPVVKTAEPQPGPSSRPDDLNLDSVKEPQPVPPLINIVIMEEPTSVAENTPSDETDDTDETSRLTWDDFVAHFKTTKIHGQQYYYPIESLKYCFWNWHFYPCLVSKIIITFLTTLFFTITPYLAYQNIDNEYVDYVPLTYNLIGIAMFICSIPIPSYLFCELDKNKGFVLVIFIAGLILSCISMFILTTAQIFMDSEYQILERNLKFGCFIFGMGFALINYFEQVVYQKVFVGNWKNAQIFLDTLTGIFVMVFYAIFYFILDVNVLENFWQIALILYKINFYIWISVLCIDFIYYLFDNCANTAKIRTELCYND